jgi:hypothetical protein
MKTLIDSYNSRPGEHCGSTAMRNLIHHYCHLDLKESDVIGLGSAPNFIFIECEANDPPILTLGRTSLMESDVTDALQIEYTEIPELNNQNAWEVVRQEVINGHPTMLSGDTYYLDYRGFGGHHFPAHRFVLVGFDDDRQKAFIADRLKPEYEECSYDALAQSRNPPLPISTFNLWGKFHGTLIGRSLKEAYKLSISKTAKRMLGLDSSQDDLLRLATDGYDIKIATGLKGIEAFARSFPSWRKRADKNQLLKYSSSCFEKFGTGGGNFRKLYANFLTSTQKIIPKIVDDISVEYVSKSAESWTQLAQTTFALTKNEDKSAWKNCSQQIYDILVLERKLFERLAESAGI